MQTLKLRPLLQLTHLRILQAWEKHIAKKVSYPNFMPTHFVIWQRADLKEIQTTCKEESHGGMLSAMHAMELRTDSLIYVLRDQ